MPKPSKNPQDLFASLAETRQKPPKPSTDEPLKQVIDEPVKRSGRAKGKRSDPNYTQVGAYIPKALDKAVKRKLLDEDMDFSELVAQLLEGWVNQ